MKIICLLILQVACLGFLYAQNTANENAAYDPHDFFAQGFNPPAGNAFRSAKGVSGPSYWQNSASYLIHAALSEKDTSVAGDVTISYTNNSPDQLEYLWLQLDQNIFKPSSISIAATPYAKNSNASKSNDGGYQIKGVTIRQGSKTYTVEPVITDTRMQLRLNTPMLARGDKCSIKI